MLRQAQDIRGGQPKAMIVLSMVGKTYRLTHDMKDAAAALELPMAKTALTLKQIYADAPGQGCRCRMAAWRADARRPTSKEHYSAKSCQMPTHRRRAEGQDCCGVTGGGYGRTQVTHGRAEDNH